MTVIESCEYILDYVYIKNECAELKNTVLNYFGIDRLVGFIHDGVLDSYSDDEIIDVFGEAGQEVVDHYNKHCK
jgi:hypothetical protein